jgi:hypothetical protein
LAAGGQITPEGAYRCIEAVLGLPLPKQATCLRLAAEASAPVWREWCERRGVPDSSGELLDTFDRWLSGASANEELDRVARRFLETLPQDLREEGEPAGGCAGWALLGIAVIALGQCGDVHRDVLHTDVCYAAAAHCRTRVGPTEVSWVRLTPAELEFLDLAGAGRPAGPGAAPGPART